MKTFDDFKKACLGTKYRKTIHIPYADEEFLMDIKILSSQEAMNAEMAALNYVTDKVVPKDSETYFIETHCQVLYRSCYENGNDDKFFKTLDDVRSLPVEILLHIWGQYSILSDSMAIISNDLDDDQVEDIKKKLSNGEIPLGLSYSQLLQALMVLGGFKSKPESELDLLLEETEVS